MSTTTTTTTTTMTAQNPGLEPFPLFIDAAPPGAANYFSDISSKMSSLQTLHQTSTSRIRRPRISMPEKLSNELRLRYFQYEVTFGLYMMTPLEKLVLNTVVVLLALALTCALYWGLHPLLLGLVCHLARQVSSSFAAGSEFCNVSE